MNCIRNETGAILNDGSIANIEQNTRYASAKYPRKYHPGNQYDGGKSEDRYGTTDLCKIVEYGCNDAFSEETEMSVTA